MQTYTKPILSLRIIGTVILKAWLADVPQRHIWTIVVIHRGIRTRGEIFNHKTDLKGHFLLMLFLLINSQHSFELDLYPINIWSTLTSIFHKASRVTQSFIHNGWLFFTLVWNAGNLVKKRRNLLPSVSN